MDKNSMNYLFNENILQIQLIQLQILFLKGKEEGAITKKSILKN